MDNSSYRLNDLENKLQIMGIRPLDVLVVGGTGCGKSSTLCSVLGRAVAAIGTGCDPQTMEVASYELNERFRLWDSPGLGDGMARDREHKKKLTDLLYKTYDNRGGTYGFIDLVLVVLDGSSRDLGTAFQLLNEVIVPNFPKDRILVAINQADMAMKGRHWLDAYNCPDPVLLQFLEEKAVSVQQRVCEATGVNILKPVYYSASTGYNVRALLDLIIDNMPRCRREMDQSA